MERLGDGHRSKSAECETLQDLPRQRSLLLNEANASLKVTAASNWSSTAKLKLLCGDFEIAWMSQSDVWNIGTKAG